jgi:hypothetical protein
MKKSEVKPKKSNFPALQLRMIKDVLLRIQKNGVKELHSDYCGLCFNLSELVKKPWFDSINVKKTGVNKRLSCYDFVNVYSKGWKHHTGSYTYPVPYTTGDEWTDKGLVFRMDLVNYLIQQIDKELTMRNTRK